jgi:CheY-like chemotaxis protein
MQPVCADAVRYIDAISAYVWFALALVVFVLLYPTIRGLIRSRAFTIKVGSMELTVQQATDQLKKQVDDLLDQVSELRLQAGGEQPAELADDPSPKTWTILWVDDRPANNAYELEKLRSDEVTVVQAGSTSEAIRMLASGRPRIDVVITDLGREEDGSYVPDAGLRLMRQARELGFGSPIYMYSWPAVQERREADVLSAGGTGLTRSPVELLAMLKTAARTSAREPGLPAG